MSQETQIDKKKSIGQVADELKVKTHVIRFWESKFDLIKPQIGRGGRRYYFGKDVEVLKKIKNFLYEEGYTISGLQKMLKQRKKDQRKLVKNQNLQILLKAEETDKENAMNSLPKQQQELINESVENIESNINKLRQLLTINN